MQHNQPAYPQVTDMVDARPLELSSILTVTVMRILSLCLGFIFCVLHSHADGSSMNRLDFPPSFVFGAGTSAYQVEGAATKDGRKPSVWDTYAHQENDLEEGTADITSDQYHKYKDDAKLMQQMGLDAYRFSISWSRLIPDGHGAVNPKGLIYYNNLIDELISHGIEAHVTLSHFDLPQDLQDEYDGFLGPKFIEDFTAYADICFKEFGDRVKYWITFNEPNTGFGFTKCFSPFDTSCSTGDLRTEIYLPAHNILLSHAAAVHVYRTKYQEVQKGKIGITLLAIWAEPLTNSLLDINLAQETIAFKFEWFLYPIVRGIYPAVMRKSLGSQLPNFTEEESTQIKGSFDFIGLNHYYGYYVQHEGSLTLGQNIRSSVDPPQHLHLPFGLGLEKLMRFVTLKYKNPPVFIHENGYGGESAQNDTQRVVYLEKHIQSLLLSMRNGSNVKGYFVWSLLDCFELFGGYTDGYGLYGVDFSDNNRTRYARQSALWYSNTFLTKIRRNPEAHRWARRM